MTVSLGQNLISDSRLSLYPNFYPPIEHPDAGTGITRTITFHAFRYTFATLQFQPSTDIYTVSKLLNHRDLEIIQLYARIVNEQTRRPLTGYRLVYK